MSSHLLDAMWVVRLANAEWTVLHGGSGLRYIIMSNIEAGIDPYQSIWILDCLDDDVITVSDLLYRLSEESQLAFYRMA